MEDLRDIAVAKKEFHVRQRLLHTPRFNTPSNKAQFIVHNIPQANTTQHYPLLLASVRSEGQFNSIIYEETDSYRHNAHRQTVFLSKVDMQDTGINNGDKVDVVSAHGCMKHVTVVSFELPKGNVMAYYPEANVLAGHELDQRSQTPSFKSIPVRIEKIT